MGIIIGIVYVLLAIMFFNNRRDYDELLNECYLISLAAFTVLIFITDILPTIFGWK